MVEIVEKADISGLPRVPKNPMSYVRRVQAVRSFHIGLEALRDAGGPVSRVTLGPKWLFPPVVVATSPQAIRDILSRKDDFVEKTVVHREMRLLIGGNLFDLEHADWLPRKRALQPVFTKQHVRQFSGDMAQAAQMVVNGWLKTPADPATGDRKVDLDAECRKLTLRALGRSVLGLDFDEHANAVGKSLQVVVKYATDRALRPVKAPRWLPTPARRRAHAARDLLRDFANQIIYACRVDPSREAPLVRALLAAVDPATGKGLSDSEICDELIIFMLAGHDTTATLLTYALWALGHAPELQDRVATEVAELGDRELTPDDTSRLTYTVQVLHEALRLCPPAAAGARTALADIEVGGYQVPEGTMLIFAIAAVQRDPSLWENPQVFDPDRFSPDKAKSLDRWQYLPFGAGQRSCIGDHFAMLEATLALATIIRTAEVRSVNDDFPVELPFTVVAAGPIPARVRSR